MSDPNQSASELVYEPGPKYFDLLLQPRAYLTRIKPTNLNEFRNIPISIYMIHIIYSTNLIG